ncbi:hypothetical protein [Streptomyces sp. HNM0645]|uniref:hypothetical protein n=1 Tax=Streptomyces sp. HNM0645 TaxID=2782343 RepID=UPI0032D5ABC6
MGEQRAGEAESHARAQAALTAEALCSNQDLAPLVKEGSLDVVGAYYLLDSGKVELLSA